MSYWWPPTEAAALLAGGGGGGSCLKDLLLAQSQLKMLLRCNEGSGNLADASGNGHTATVNGTVTYGATALVGTDTSIDWDGSTGYATVADHADLDLGDGPFTIGCVVNFDAFGGTILFGKQAASGASGYALYINSSGVPRLINGDGTVIVAQDDASLSTATRYLLVATYNGTTTGKIYVNGVDGTDTTNSTTLTDNSDALGIAGENDGGGNDLNGRAAYFFVIKAEVDATTIASWWDAIDVTCAAGQFPFDPWRPLMRSLIAQ